MSSSPLSSPPADSSFTALDEEQLEHHLNRAYYRDFELTEAVRPAPSLAVFPREGYRFDQYIDKRTGVSIPVLMAAATRRKLLPLFQDLLTPVGEMVDVVLETSHERQDGLFLVGGHQDLYREGIDLPVLKSILGEYDDLLLDDGCTGVCVLNPQTPVEVQFDEHKLLIVYGHELGVFEEACKAHGLKRDDSMKFITEAEHCHASSEEFQAQFRELVRRICSEY